MTLGYRVPKSVSSKIECLRKMRRGYRGVTHNRDGLVGELIAEILQHVLDEQRSLSDLAVCAALVSNSKHQGRREGWKGGRANLPTSREALSFDCSRIFIEASEAILFVV